MKTALISVYDNTNIVLIANYLLKNNYQILSTSNTYHKLVSKFEGDPDIISNIRDVSSYINHPTIYNGILADRNSKENLDKFEIQPIDIVIVNLYPFKELSNNPRHSGEYIIENIDINGHTLIRAAAKNYKNVLVITNPNDYNDVINNLSNFKITNRKIYANKAFNYITIYDSYISNYFQTSHEITHGTNICPDVLVSVYEKQKQLKYSINSQHHLVNSALYKNISLNNYQPFTILNGHPEYINILDAVYSWNLVDELSKILGLHAVASFKNNNPVGVAVYSPLNEKMRRIYNLDINQQLSNISIALIKARNVNPTCSNGDFIAISGTVHIETAKLISQEMSNGIIAYDYSNEAYEILKSKNNGNYIILKAAGFPGNHREVKELHGVVLVKEKNRQITGYHHLNNVVTANELSSAAKIDLIIANTTLKYTQSNSIVYAIDGQSIGICAGQQSCIDGIKLGKRKVEMWYLRQHPKCISLYEKFCKEIDSHTKINAILRYIEGDFTTQEYQNWSKLFTEKIDVLTQQEKRDFLKTLNNVSLASNEHIPHRDSIDVSSQIGVKYILQPGKSEINDEIIEVANEYGIGMVLTGQNMYLH
jgi:phosphoribosylaminoimidazolecarboxamide formyltransferase/IMP cyclohydrolase